ncbi:YHS domain-containing protein [uncultured Pedobacter sp.]|uniref:YHS domain-containing protein n=1 Tax=uncultured Pedobacter sp. TaxID=246139 RepID=UPI0025D3071B|nr:YHS domain-containing protein [uncultured Pedobacter sp.]
MKKIMYMLGVVLLLSISATKANDKVVSETLQTDTLKKDDSDPVCKMKVKAGNTRTAVYEKTIYGFCSESCRKKFAIEPKKYIKK